MAHGNHTLGDALLPNCGCCGTRIYSRTVEFTSEMAALRAAADSPPNLGYGYLQWPWRMYKTWSVDVVINNAHSYHGIKAVYPNAPDSTPYHYVSDPDNVYDGTVTATWRATATLNAPWVVKLDGKHAAKFLEIDGVLHDGREVSTQAISVTRDEMVGGGYTAGTPLGDASIEESKESREKPSTATLHDVISAWTYAFHGYTMEVVHGSGDSETDGTIQTLDDGWVIHMVRGADGDNTSTIDDVIELINKVGGIAARRAPGCDGLDLMEPCGPVTLGGGESHGIIYNQRVMPFTWNGETVPIALNNWSLGWADFNENLDETPETSYTLSKSWTKDVDFTLYSSPGTPPFPAVHGVTYNDTEVTAAMWTLTDGKEAQMGQFSGIVGGYTRWDVADSDLVEEIDGEDAYTLCSLGRFEHPSGDGYEQITCLKRALFLGTGGRGTGGAVVAGFKRWTPEGEEPGEWQPFSVVLPPMVFRDKLLAGPLQFDPPSWVPGELVVTITAVFLQP